MTTKEESERHNVTSFEGGGRSCELEAEKGKEIHSLLEPPEKNTTLLTP